MAPDRETVLGGMLNPDAFGVLDPGSESGSGVNQGRERDYEQVPDYGEVDSEALGHVLGDEPGVYRGKVATDGGYTEETLRDVEHTPPDWTNMENPSL